MFRCFFRRHFLISFYFKNWVFIFLGNKKGGNRDKIPIKIRQKRIEKKWRKKLDGKCLFYIDTVSGDERAMCVSICVENSWVCWRRTTLAANEDEQRTRDICARQALTRWQHTCILLGAFLTVCVVSARASCVALHVYGNFVEKFVASARYSKQFHFYKHQLSLSTWIQLFRLCSTHHRLMYVCACISRYTFRRIAACQSRANVHVCAVRYFQYQNVWFLLGKYICCLRTLHHCCCFFGVIYRCVCRFVVCCTLSIAYAIWNDCTFGGHEYVSVYDVCSRARLAFSVCVRVWV